MGFGHEVNAKRGPKGNAPVSRPPNPFGTIASRQTRANLSDVPFGMRAIDAAVDQGCAVMVARTRDGGAYSLTILDGDDRFRAYAADQAELNTVFEQITAAYVKPD